MTLLVLPVGQTQDPLDLLEFAQPPGTALVGDNAAPVSGYPDATRRLRSLQVQLSIHTDLNGTYAWALASDPGTLDPVEGTTSPSASGVWSGASGSEQTWSGDLKGWRIPDFGAWETDYITFTSSSTQTVEASGDAIPYRTFPMDLRVRCRRTDWDAVNGIAVKLRSTDQGLWSIGGNLSFRWNDGSTQTESIPWSTLGVVDGEWVWLRVTVDGSDDLRWYTSSDGSSWTQKGATVSVPDFDIWMATTVAPEVGGGGPIGGFNGDISHVEMWELGGALTWHLNLDEAESAADTVWPTGVTGRNWVRYSSSLPAITGAVRGTEVITFTPEHEFQVGDVRFIFGANDDGLITVDEFIFDLVPRPLGWKVGML